MPRAANKGAIGRCNARWSVVHLIGVAIANLPTQARVLELFLEPLRSVESPEKDRSVGEAWLQDPMNGGYQLTPTVRKETMETMGKLRRESG